MTMKRKVLFLMLTILFALPSFAQKHHDKDKEARRKEMMEFKLKFIGDEIGLNDDQKKQFNDIYTQMETERRQIFRKIKNAEKKIADNKNASEEDYEKANKEISDAKNEMTAIDKKYEDKFTTFLSKKQIYNMKAAETKFMETMRDCRDKKRAEKK